MLEKNLIKAINNRLPRKLHSQSMTFGSASMNGTPDRYYDGSKDDLWVEYKMLDAMPRSKLVGGVDAKKKGCYSPLQYDWMCRRYNHCLAAGRTPNVIGIVGLPDRTAVIQFTPDEWLNGTPVSSTQSFDDIAKMILSFVGPPLGGT